MKPARLVSILLWLGLVCGGLFAAYAAPNSECGKVIVGIVLQFLGTVYWADRILDKAAWIGGFVITGASSQGDRCVFGIVAAISYALGAVILVDTAV